MRVLLLSFGKYPKIDSLLLSLCPQPTDSKPKPDKVKNYLSLARTQSETVNPHPIVQARGLARCLLLIVIFSFNFQPAQSCVAAYVCCKDFSLEAELTAQTRL